MISCHGGRWGGYGRFVALSRQDLERYFYPGGRPRRCAIPTRPTTSNAV